MEVNTTNDAGVPIGYRLQVADYTIAPSAPYQVLLLNQQPGCFAFPGLRERERSRRLTDTWASNTPCCASPGELGWEACADEEILLSSCGLSPPMPHSVVTQRSLP